MYRLYGVAHDGRRDGDDGYLPGDHPDLAAAEDRAREAFGDADTAVGSPGNAARIEAHDAAGVGRAGQPPALTFYPNGRAVGPWHRLVELEDARGAASRGR